MAPPNTDLIQREKRFQIDMGRLGWLSKLNAYENIAVLLVTNFTPRKMHFVDEKSLATAIIYAQVVILVIFNLIVNTVMVGKYNLSLLQPSLFIESQPEIVNLSISNGFLSG